MYLRGVLVVRAYLLTRKGGRGKKNGGAHGRQRAPTVHDVAAKNRHLGGVESAHRVTISGGRIV